MPIMFGWRDARGCVRMVRGWRAGGCRMVFEWFRHEAVAGGVSHADGPRMVCGWCLDDGNARRPARGSSADGKKVRVRWPSGVWKRICSRARARPNVSRYAGWGWGGGGHKTHARPTRKAACTERHTRDCDARAHLALARVLCHIKLEAHRHTGWSHHHNCVCVCENSRERCAVTDGTECRAQRIARAT